MWYLWGFKWISCCSAVWLVGLSMSHSTWDLWNLCSSRLLNSCSLPGFAHLSVLSWVFSQRLKGASIQISEALFLCSSLVFSTLPHKFQLPQQAESLISASQLIEATVFCLGSTSSLYYGLESISRKKAR